MWGVTHLSEVTHLSGVAVGSGGDDYWQQFRILLSVHSQGWILPWSDKRQPPAGWLRCPRAGGPAAAH